MLRLSAIALTVGALLWSALLLIAPLSFAAHPALATTAAFIYEAAGYICHQRAERSFHLHGVQLPVCARCAGLYFSGAAGALAAWGGWRRTSPVEMRAALIAAAVPTAVTVALEWFGFAHPSNAVRAVAALPLGAAGGWVLVRMLRDEAAAGSATARAREPQRSTSDTL